MFLNKPEYVELDITAIEKKELGVAVSLLKQIHDMFVKESFAYVECDVYGQYDDVRCISTKTIDDTIDILGYLCASTLRCYRDKGVENV